MARTASSSASVEKPLVSNEEDQDLNKPLWKYVIRCNRMSRGGENLEWMCNFCHQSKKVLTLELELIC